MYDPRIHHRKSIRLPGHDYSSPGSYYVTVCAAERQCLFGDIKNSKIILSDIGRIVDTDFRAISSHFPDVSLDTFQVMPNHLHAIITIKGKNRRDTTPSCPAIEYQSALHQRQFGKPVASSLSTIIGAFKSGVTINARNAGLLFDGTLWQSRFYDHVIRDDVDFFMVQQYITLNPLMWERDINNPDAKTISLAVFEKMLQERYQISEKALYMIVNSKKFGRLRITS